MSRFIYMLLCAIVGGVLASANVRVSNWQFWVVLGCVIGAHICDYITGMKYYT